MLEQKDINYFSYINANNRINNVFDNIEISSINEINLIGGGAVSNAPFEVSTVGTYQGPSEADVKEHTQYSIYNRKKLNYAEPSKTNLYTIPQGTILYHGSMYKEAFNPFDIKLGDDHLVSYFSPNKRLAADYIVSCFLYPSRQGFLHKFRVKKDIERIMILSTFEKRSDWTLSFIEDTFCSRKFRIQLDGIGFFFPRRDVEDMQNIQTNPIDTGNGKVSFDAEFAICNPDEYLEYISTQRCISMRKLSDQYTFTK